MGTLRLALAGVACWLALGAVLEAGPWRCPACGSYEMPCRVRRLVPGVERVVTYQYFDRRETWCVQGPSRCVGKVKQQCEDPNAMVPQFDNIWQPTCGPSFTCSRLWKRPVVVERPVLHCVLEDKCTHCGVAQAARQAHPMWVMKKRPKSTTEVAAGQPAAVVSVAGATPAPVGNVQPEPASPGPTATAPHWFSPLKIE